MAAGVLNWVASNVADEQYKIVTLDKKVDSLEIIDCKHQHKAIYQRCDIKCSMSLFEKALYNSAKHNPEKFRELYYDLKNHDLEFFRVASKVLRTIHSEYNFI